MSCGVPNATFPSSERVTCSCHPHFRHVTSISAWTLSRIRLERRRSSLVASQIVAISLLLLVHSDADVLSSRQLFSSCRPRPVFPMPWKLFLVALSGAYSLSALLSTRLLILTTAFIGFVLMRTPPSSSSSTSRLVLSASSYAFRVTRRGVCAFLHKATRIVSRSSTRRSSSSFSSRNSYICLKSAIYPCITPGSLSFA
jgi:hypothetical protein